MEIEETNDGVSVLQVRAMKRAGCYAVPGGMGQASTLGSESNLLLGKDVETCVRGRAGGKHTGVPLGDF